MPFLNVACFDNICWKICYISANASTWGFETELKTLYIMEKWIKIPFSTIHNEQYFFNHDALNMSSKIVCQIKLLFLCRQWLLCIHWIIQSQTSEWHSQTRQSACHSDHNKMFKFLVPHVWTPCQHTECIPEKGNKSVWVPSLDTYWYSI